MTGSFFSGWHQRLGSRLLTNVSISVAHFYLEKTWLDLLNLQVRKWPCAYVLIKRQAATCKQVCKSTKQCSLIIRSQSTSFLKRIGGMFLLLLPDLFSFFALYSMENVWWSVWRICVIQDAWFLYNSLLWSAQSGRMVRNFTRCNLLFGFYCKISFWVRQTTPFSRAYSCCRRGSIAAQQVVLVPRALPSSDYCLCCSACSSHVCLCGFPFLSWLRFQLCLKIWMSLCMNVYDTLPWTSELRIYCDRDQDKAGTEDKW